MSSSTSLSSSPLPHPWFWDQNKTCTWLRGREVQVQRPRDPRWLAGILEACVKAAGLAAHNGSHSPTEFLGLARPRTEALSTRARVPAPVKPAAPATQRWASFPLRGHGPPWVLPSGLPGASPVLPGLGCQGKCWQAWVLVGPHLLWSPCHPPDRGEESGQVSFLSCLCGDVWRAWVTSQQHFSGSGDDSCT